jgi:flagellar L-ring protein precursor FlgH
MQLIFLFLAAPPVVPAQSLYAEQTYRPLASPKHARRVGDNLTILVYENSSATTVAGTSLRRNSDVGVHLGANRHQHDARVGTSNDFDGGGTIQRSGRLLAQLTVAVTSVAPNGDLWVSGVQSVTLNGDRQQIKVEGRVRPLDISELNTVQSNRLGEARISYVGHNSELAERQRPGWLSRFITWLGL